MSACTGNGAKGGCQLTAPYIVLIFSLLFFSFRAKRKMKIEKESCSCSECIECCWRSPGWFGNIEEIKGAAKIKQMSVHSFIHEYLIREWYYAETIEIPAPRRNFEKEKNVIYTDTLKEEIEINGKGFVRASWGHNLITGFACIFLEDNMCSIHDSKPLECKESFGCRTVFPSRQHIEDYWKKHQKWVKHYTK